MPTTNQSMLDITVVCMTGRWRVVVRGELDLCSGRDLVAVASVLGDARAPLVDFDLGEVTFVDTAGCEAIGTAIRTVELAGGTSTVATRSPAVARVGRLLTDLTAAPGAGRRVLATAG